MIDLYIVGYGIIGLLGFLLIIGMPIGIALAASGIVGLFLTRGWTSIEFLLGSSPYSLTAELAYIVIPLFLFMGHMTFVGGISERAFSAAERAIGHVSGGLAIATVMASAAFAMVCGSSVASASTMGRVAIPEMLKRGYAKSLAAGAVAAGGTLGVLIPPSGVLVIYSIATQTSLPDLFMAAIIPGLITAVAYAAMIYLMVKVNPGLVREQSRAPRKKQSFKELLSTWEIAFLFAIVMGSIYLGIATPTEAAAVGALVATALVLRQPGSKIRIIRDGLLETGAATASIFLLIIGAGLFSMALSTTQIPTSLVNWMTGISDSRYVILVLILLPYFVLGMFIDGISMILLTMPIVFPVVLNLGFDPVWFGIVVTKTVEIGLMTPPVGLNAFVVKNVAPSIPLGQIFRGCAPFAVLEIVLVAVLIMFPELAMMTGR